MDQDKLQQIKEQLNSVPAEPGVYLWKDKSGTVIYVGKAKQLRARMRQYVNFQDDRAKIPLLVSQIDSFEYIVTANEHESLVLERNLIEQYSPYFNADFKDDKSYPFIALTKGDIFPAIKYTRESHKATTRYFGPYTDSRAARNLVDIVRRIVPICSSSCSEWRRLNRKLDQVPYDELELDERPCFDCHVGLGPVHVVAIFLQKRTKSKFVRLNDSFPALIKNSLMSSNPKWQLLHRISTLSVRDALKRVSTQLNRLLKLSTPCHLTGLTPML